MGHAEDERLGINNDGKSNYPVVPLSETDSARRTGQPRIEEQQENSGKQDEEEDGIFGS